MEWGVMSIRWFSLFIICFLLIEPMVKWLNQHKEKPLVVLAVDNSESMLAGDKSNYLKTEFAAQLQNLKEELSDKFKIATFTLGSQTKISDSLSFQEKQSKLSEGLTEIENYTYQQNHAATILFSDGMYNEGSNPIYTISRTSAPIYTVGFGDSTQRKDALIKKVLAPQQVFADNSFEIAIDLQAYFCSQETLKIELKENGKLLYSGQEKAIGSKFFKQHKISLNKASEGIHTYEISISPLSNEASYANNKVSVQINSLRNKQKILLLYLTPHPDIGAIQRTINQQNNYQVEVLSHSEFKLDKLGETGLVILHQLPGNKGEGVQLINQFKEKNVPLFYILGKQTGISFFNQVSKQRLSATAQNQNEAQAWVNSQFNLFQLDENMAEALTKFNPLYTTYGNYQLSIDAQVLLNQQIGFVKTNIPLLAFSNQSGANQAFLFGEGIWRWFLQDYLIHNNQEISGGLLNKIIQWTLGKNDRSKFRVEPSKKIFDENESVNFEAVLFNDLYEKINTPDISLQLSNESGKVYPYQFSKNNDAYQLELGNLSPGKYTYTAAVNGGNYPIKKGSITVKSLQIEALQTQANFPLLRSISNETNAKFYFPTELKQLKEELLKQDNFKTIIHEQEELVSLIQYKILFFLIVLLLSLEWFIRKWQGMI
ncbi:MAG: VWA domain-containing protein [Bacteroidia bacterium]|nr:VWA domain-containing protein [Bacteroidia bacterium]